MSPTRQRRILFLALILALHAQLAFSYLVSEPYPGVFMPAFGGPLHSEDGLAEFNDTRILVTFSDASTESIDRNRLLADARRSQRTSIMRWVFTARDNPKPPPEDPPWVQWLKTHLFPYRLDHNRRWYENHTHPRTKRWLQKRTAELWPHRPPAAAVTFQWKRVTVDLQTGRRTQTHLYDYEISLDPNNSGHTH